MPQGGAERNRARAAQSSTRDGRASQASPVARVTRKQYEGPNVERLASSDGRQLGTSVRGGQRSGDGGRQTARVCV